ncbi:MAG: class A beta-lactamase-related serine hydrolase, partial [Gemmiger sp.]|nr:class A beta-lactamase-related serine hydrolase [Gemmiger sp.]
ATGETAADWPAMGLTQTVLTQYCAQQPDSISVWAKDLTTGEVFTYDENTLYYGASTLKTPYALWLCQQADTGAISLDMPLPNTHYGRLADTPLATYNESETVPLAAAITAMIADSDNDATDLLMAALPGTADTGYQAFLQALGYTQPDSCHMTVASGIEGYLSAADAGATMQALWGYFATGTPGSDLLYAAFTQANHSILYQPEGVVAAKKYGSWDAAFHDEMIVYDDKPYILCCFTNWGDTEVDFPPEAVSRMQTLGQLVNSCLEMGG